MKVEEILKILKARLECIEFLERHRVNPKDFSRKKKLPFCKLLLSLLNFLNKSLAVEIDTLITHLGQQEENSENMSYTPSAFVQARQKLKPTAFIELSNLLIEEVYKNNTNIQRWRKFRLFAIDGSTHQVPDTEETVKHFGVSKNRSTLETPQAKVSTLYDLLNDYIFTAEISPLDTGERDLALQHLQQIPPDPNDLFIFDRGYPSFGFFYSLIEEGRQFVIRAKVGYLPAKDFMESKERSRIIELSPDRYYNRLQKKKNTKIRVRLVKVRLDNGETELLITSLLDEQEYSASIFKKLYFMRWKIETFYDEFKNNLKVEFFSGIKLHNILQDFYIAVLLSNIQSMIINDIREEIKLKCEGRKYKYKANRNVSYGFMKNRILDVFFSLRPISEVLLELKELFKKNLVPIIPHRTVVRDVENSKKRRRKKTPKNHKDAI